MKRLRNGSPSGRLSGLKKTHTPMSRRSVALQGESYSSFPLSNESSYRACRAWGQQPTQPVEELVSPLAQCADSSKHIRMICTRGSPAAQSVNFSGSSSAGCREISISSENRNILQPRRSSTPVLRNRGCSPPKRMETHISRPEWQRKSRQETIF